MSARDLLLPNRALLDTLNNLSRRLMATQRRARFPGVVRTETDSGGSITLGSYLSPPANNILTLTLEKGRWFLYGGIVMLATPVGSNGFKFELYIVSTSLPYPDVKAYDFADGATPTDRPLAVIATVSLTASETFTLQARGGVSLSGTMAYEDAYLIAVPA